MVPSKMNHPLAVIIFFLLLSLPFPSLHATEYYALRLTGSDCLLCHIDPGIGSLNQTGVRFQEEGDISRREDENLNKVRSDEFVVRS